MGKVKIETPIKASIEICFDLSRSIDLHMASAQETNERAIAGVTTGLVTLGDSVTWEATHFGIKQQLKVKISMFDRPKHFQDTQVSGIFKSFTHDHIFTDNIDHTLMVDIFDFQCPFGVLGQIVEPIIFTHMKKFLTQRNTIIKKIAESDEWRGYITPPHRISDS